MIVASGIQRNSAEMLAIIWKKTALVQISRVKDRLAVEPESP